MQRMVVVGQNVHHLGWADAQPGQDRNAAIAEGAVMVRFVLGEYLPCEVIWGEDMN
jgi:hypothetical protein